MAKSTDRIPSADLPGRGMAVLELPDLIQSISQTGRSGQLRVRSEGRELSIHLRNGLVVACDNGRLSSLSRALVWTGQVPPGSYRKLGIPEPQALSDRELGELLLEMKIVELDGLRDAVDCHIEECFTEALSWPHPNCDMLATSAPNDWCAYQASLGTAIPAGSALMEGMRRLDESKRIARLTPGRWDVLVREPLDHGQLQDGERRVLVAWREGRPAGAVLELSGLPPWAASHAVARLIERGVLRLADGAELVVYGDKARNQEHYRTAEGLYRRALEMGAVAGRVHLALGELSERRADERQAAADYLRGAESLEVANPVEAVLALRSALRLGADRERCLKRLLTIYQRLGEKDDALDVLFQLAEFYEGGDRIEEAMEVVREAQRLDADPLRCAQVLAALALLADDQGEALVQLEQVIAAALAAGQQSEADKARRQLLLIEPGRCRIALDYARDAAQCGRREEAVEVLRRALTVANRTTSEDLDVALRETLAESDPHDKQNRDWLARTYQRRKDRVGASIQLEKLAETQERDGDLDGLAGTLQRLIGLGGEVGPLQRRLAGVLHRQGRGAASVQAWLAALAVAQAAGAELAAAWAEEALLQHPTSFELLEIAADLAATRGEQEEAAERFALAARLAVVLGDGERLARSLDRFRNLRPDSLWARIEALEYAERHDFPERDVFLADLVRWSRRRHDLGLALRVARLRVRGAAAPAFAERQELVELLAATGRDQEHLTEGQRLFRDLCAGDRLEQAREVLAGLITQHPADADLLVQHADLLEALDRDGEVPPCLRRAITLLQQAERSAEAVALCDRLESLQPGDPEVQRARVLLAEGEAVNWAAIHDERTLASKRRLAAEDGADGTTERRATAGAGSRPERRVATGSVGAPDDAELDSDVI